ncbi:hypothetical protein OG723_44080 (plasmid) [Streptomyces sp. NBC_01278]|uniref:hypothetical protein n=1 Tax=Streptomyces sp. NBC_01278 TaxID=2903809 RepID=UPI002E2ECA2F|nr:hypothetical protein [Streptomyces sp. NBC_01278]
MTGESTSRSTSTLKHPHTWVVAAEIVVDDAVARIADFRGSFRTKTEQRIDALDTYCRACRRPYADVAKSDCAAAVDNRHLIGGDQSVRAKRKMPTPPPAGAKLVPGGKFTRYGLKAYVSGVSRPPV